MKKFTFSIIFFIVMGCVNMAFAQGAYDSAIGLRFGSPLAISYKKFVKDDIAAEGYLAFRSFSGYSFTSVALSAQKHNPISEVENLSWYYGAGAGLFFYSFDNDFVTDSGSLGIGLQGYLGLDYAFSEIPLNLSIDWIPTIFISGFGSGFGAGYGTLSARYILNQ